MLDSAVKGLLPADQTVSTAATPQLARRRLLLGAGAAALASASPVLAQAPAANAGTWPNKPVRVVVPFAAGGLTDTNARLYCEFLSKKFGQNFLVDNRPGAGGILGVDAVAKAAPDGYTLLATTLGSMWPAKGLYNRLPFDYDRDLAPITLFPSGALVLGVPKNAPYNDARGYFEFAQKNPTSFGTYGIGSWPHMIAENWIKYRKATNVSPIHYKGEAPMWVDVASQQIQSGVGSYLQFAMHQTKGLIKPLGVTGSVRSPKIADVPTLAEQGFTDPIHRLEGWMPMAAPAGTPEEILRKISAAVLEAADTPKIAALRDTYSIGTLPTNFDDTQRRWKEDSVIWTNIASELGIKLDS